MSIPVIQLEEHIAGDTWQGIPTIGPFIINGAQPGSPVARVRMKLTQVRDADPQSLEFDTVPGAGVHPIEIVDAANWECTIPPVAYTDFTLPEGNYEGQLEFTDTSGERITTHELRMKIKPDK